MAGDRIGFPPDSRTWDSQTSPWTAHRSASSYVIVDSAPWVNEAHCLASASKSRPSTVCMELKNSPSDLRASRASRMSSGSDREDPSIMSPTDASDRSRRAASEVTSCPRDAESRCCLMVASCARISSTATRVRSYRHASLLSLRARRPSIRIAIQASRIVTVNGAANSTARNRSNPLLAASVGSMVQF